MKDRHYAYLGGVLDGDGCFNAYSTSWQGSTWNRVYVSAVSVERKGMLQLAEWFGGKVSKRTRDHYRQGFIWEWRLTIKESLKPLLDGVTPYLVIKKDQATLANTFINLPRNSSSEREFLVVEIQRLNQQRPDPSKLTVDFGKMKWPYLAGLMDSEGTFTVRRDIRENYIHYGIWARFANTSEYVIQWLETFFGGQHFSDEKSKYWPLPYERKEKERFLLHLLPYLVTKKEQAKILLEYTRLGDERNPAKREDLYRRCYLLNHPPVSVK